MARGDKAKSLNAMPVALVKKSLDRAGYSIDENGCHIWGGVVSTNGYGVVSIKSLRFHAHRAAMVAECGPIAPGMVVCHKCDVRNCVNPEHLFVGTQSDNMKDASRKGRITAFRHPGSMVRGEAHKMARLTDAAAEDIRTSSLEPRFLMAKYSVAYSTVYRVKRGLMHRPFSQAIRQHSQKGEDNE